MSMTIGAAMPAFRPSPPASPAGGGIVALAVAARGTQAAAPLQATLQATDSALASAVASLGTDITA